MSAAIDFAIFDLDAARSGWRPAARAAGLLVAHGLEPFGEALDRLLSEHMVPLLRRHPDLDALALENELASDLTNEAATFERTAFEEAAVQRSPGLLHRRHTSTGGTELTGLGPYFPAITEPRESALARQKAAIESTIAEGARIGAARRELARRRDAELPFLQDPTPAAKAAVTRRLHREVAAERGFAGGRIPVAPRMLSTGAQGTSKTATALKAVARVPERLTIRFAVPSLDKAAEALDDYRAAARPDSLPAMLVRGRAAADPAAPSGAAMCPRHEVADLVSKAGLSVRTTMCATCPLREACGYRRQEAAIEAMGGIGLFFMASAGLSSASPAPAADLLIVDERLAAEDVLRVPLDVLCAETLPYPGGEGLAAYTKAHVTMDAVREALAGPGQLAMLRGEGITAAHLDNAICLLRPLAEPAPLPAGLTDRQLHAALDQRAMPAAADALKLLCAVKAEFDQPRPNMNGVTTPDKRGEVAVCRLQRLRGIAGAAVLALDGTGNPDLARHLFGTRMEHVQCRVERDAHVTSPIAKGPIPKSYSRQSFTGEDAKGRPLAGKQARSKLLRQDVAAIAAQLPGPVLVVSSQQAEVALLDHLPTDTPTTHYGDLRGKNAWEHCASVITAGPAPIGLEDVELLGRCYMASDPEPFISSTGAAWPVDCKYRRRGWPFWCTRMRRMRDGSLHPVEVAVHPDPRVQQVLEQVREAEAVQAIDRTRPVWQHRHVVALDSLVLDVTYDACPTHGELVAGGTPWERCARALGVIPLGVRDLAEVRAFSTRKAAERGLESTPSSEIELIFKDRGYLIAAYRRRGQRGSLSRALIDPARHPDLQAALTALLGPLVWFEMLPAAAPPVHVPPPAERPIAVPVKLLVPARPARRRAEKPPRTVLIQSTWPSPERAGGARLGSLGHMAAGSGDRVAERPPPWWHQLAELAVLPPELPAAWCEGGAK